MAIDESKPASHSELGGHTGNNYIRRVSAGTDPCTAPQLQGCSSQFITNCHTQACNKRESKLGGASLPYQMY